MYRKVITILTHPRTLRKKAVAFPAFNDLTAEDHSHLQDLKDTFAVLQGYGLAAPQIGISKRAIIVNLSALGVGNGPALMINPTLEVFGDVQRNEEACYSVPHISAQVRRPVGCKVEYVDESGQENVLELEGFPAACLQHEVDHLDGKIYLDRVGSAWRTLLMNKVRKIEKRKKEKEKAAKEEFEREHRELMGITEKKTTHSRKRKPKKRKKRLSKSKKRK